MKFQSMMEFVKAIRFYNFGFLYFFHLSNCYLSIQFDRKEVYIYIIYVIYNFHEILFHMIYRCRSAYKLLEIQEKYKLMRPGQVVVDLGCAPGSWTQVAVRATKAILPGYITKTIKIWLWGSLGLGESGFKQTNTIVIPLWVAFCKSLICCNRHKSWSIRWRSLYLRCRSFQPLNQNQMLTQHLWRHPNH